MNGGGNNNKIGLLILCIVISLFVTVLFILFNKEINHNEDEKEENVYIQKLNDYDLNSNFSEYSEEIKNLSFEDKKSLCEYMEQDPFSSNYDKKKLHDACLLNFINYDIYDERLCGLMYGVIEDKLELPEYGHVIELSYKQDCFANIAVNRGDISYCKNQGEACIIFSEMAILYSNGNVDCNIFYDEEKNICRALKLSIKYGSLIEKYVFDDYKVSGVDDEMVKEYDKIAQSRFKEFGTVENLCDSFVNDFKDDFDKGDNKLYNICVSLYMENQNQNNVEYCKKLKYSEIESRDGITLTEKDLCLSQNIIDKSKNIKDCQFADYNHICVSIVAHELGDKSNCDILSSSVNKELCYKFSGKEPPIKSKLMFRDDCLIKGNISYNNGEKIYHLPGCEYYEETVINPTYGERRFCSEQEAIDAGWRKAKNCY